MDVKTAFLHGDLDKEIYMEQPEGDLTWGQQNKSLAFAFSGVEVSRRSILQKSVATLSTTEAEYVAATEACKELLWLKRFLQELGFKQQRYAVLCDNHRFIRVWVSAVERRFCFRICVYTVVTHCTLPVKLVSEL
ncbi:hypothetical protein Tco_0456379 [Tanacetum coccineum]